MVEDIREMLAGLPPSDWERHMAEVAAYEAALVAERDRWRNRARAMHRQAVQRHRRIQNMVADNLAADESNDAGFVALRERLAEAETHSARHHAELKGAEAVIGTLRGELAEAQETIARLARQNARLTEVARISNKQRDDAEVRANEAERLNSNQRVMFNVVEQVAKGICHYKLDANERLTICSLCGNMVASRFEYLPPERITHHPDCLTMVARAASAASAPSAEELHNATH